MPLNNSNRVEIKTQEGNYKPAPYDLVKGIVQGNDYVDVIYMKNKINTHVKRIDKDTYMDLSTGEIKKYNHKDPTEVRDYFVLQRTFRKLRQLIRHNFTGGEGEVFMTLTYQSNMQNTNKLYDDFKKFMIYLRRHYPQYSLDYITVAEPQGRGSWHFHVMMKCHEDLSLWFNQSVLKRLWNSACKETGSARIERIKSNDIGSYYVAYFTDLVQAKETDTSEAKSKSRIKGGRLHFYPKSFKFYRCSRGIKKPVETTFYLNELDNDYNLTYERSVDIIKSTYDDNFIFDEKNIKTNQTNHVNEMLNKIYKATYKRKEEIKLTLFNIPIAPKIKKELELKQSKLNLGGGIE